MARKKKKGNKKSFKRPQGKRFVVGVFRLTRALLIVASVPALFYLMLQTYGEFKSSPYLEVKTIKIKGAKSVTNDEIINMAAIGSGKNIFDVDIDRVGRIIEAHPYVKSVRVFKDYPDAIRVEIKERVPSAFVSLGKLYVMDSEGTIMKSLTQTDDLDLPVVTGLDSEGGLISEAALKRELLMVMDSLKRSDVLTMDEISEIHMDSVYGAYLYRLADGLKIGMGRGLFDRKLSNFGRVMEVRGGDLNHVEYVELDDDGEVLLRFSRVEERLI